MTTEWTPFLAAVGIFILVAGMLAAMGFRTKWLWREMPLWYKLLMGAFLLVVLALFLLGVIQTIPEKLQ